MQVIMAALEKMAQAAVVGVESVDGVSEDVLEVTRRHAAHVANVALALADKKFFG